MATRRYSANPGDSLEAVVEAVGAATATKAVELTVDCAATIVNDGGVQRKIQREEVLICLNEIMQYITRSNWPPV